MKRKILLFLLLFFCTQTSFAEEVLPYLEFPQAGMDDPSRYKDFKTRFIRDSAKNVLQIYLNESSGRVVHLWADDLNESIGFTARDSSGKPANLQWCSKGTDVTSHGEARFVEYRLCAATSSIRIGHFLLGTMRKERDFQYFKKDLLPFDSEPFHEPELLTLIANLEKLPAEQRSAHLALLKAKNPEELRSRMDPNITQEGSRVSVQQVYFDGNNHLWLDISSDTAKIALNNSEITIESDGDLRFTIRVGVDGRALSPLDRTEIFNKAFLDFYAKAQREASQSATARTRFQWLDREVRGMELVCYKEKLMAGLPNFATYFGRDTMMSALMFQPIWSVSMLEHSISSVLVKLLPNGLVSHEEALGGQAIRENADEYNKLIEQYIQKKDPGALEKARKILSNLQAVRENYLMVDDDFQLPVLLGRYLNDPGISSDRKRTFLNQNVPAQGVSRWTLILRNFGYVAEAASAYVKDPVATNLVSFPKRDAEHWKAASWRDSDAGYGGGRFGMDVNVIWVPFALDSIRQTLQLLPTLGLEIGENDGSLQLRKYARNPESLQRATGVWHGAIRHFQVRLSREELLRQVGAKLDWMPNEERTYWKGMLERKPLPEQLQFLAISLDENGKPIQILNTDPATLLYLADFTKDILQNEARSEAVHQLVDPILLAYPAGLLVQDLGPVCANDAYTSRKIWERFEKDQYHSPRVVWGREVNLLTLGLLKQILAAHDSAGRLKSEGIGPYVRYLQDALKRVRQAVEESGLKHNELWSYRIEGGKLIPTRYGSTSDIQLWNLTDLSIQYFLARL